MEEKNVPNHIYIVDRETNKIAAEAINGHALFQIQQLESAGKFDQEYFVQITPDDRSEDEDAWLGFYPAAWDPYIMEELVREEKPAEVKTEDEHHLSEDDFPVRLQEVL